MADELKDQRVVTMMSPSELMAIDDWMFRRRVRSRGEAIRRLCQLGMLLEKRHQELFERSVKHSQEYSDDGQQLKALGLNKDMPADVRTVILETHMRALQGNFEAMLETGKIAIEASALLSGKSVTEAMKLAKDIDDHFASLSPEEKPAAVVEFLRGLVGSSSSASSG